LASRADGLATPGGQLLDGNADNTPGGNFVGEFTVADDGLRSVSVPDVVRGRGQAVDIDSSGGIPVSIDNADGLLELTFTATFDPSSLDVFNASLPASLPGDWQIDSQQLLSPGVFEVTISGATPLPGGPMVLAILAADVPDVAGMGSSSLIQIRDVVANQGNLPARGDDAVGQVNFLGDASGDGGYSAFDASLIARVGVGLDSGFDAYPRTDPRLIGDVTRDGTNSAFDASIVARKALDLPQIYIPELPVEMQLVSPAPPLVAAEAQNKANNNSDGIRASDLLAAWDISRSEFAESDEDALAEDVAQRATADDIASHLVDGALQGSTSFHFAVESALKTAVKGDDDSDAGASIDDAESDADELLRLLASDRPR
jgi:hypothetical protein